MKSYSEKLKDPRWQKKRLKILERDNWMCTECPCKTDTLHVHHKSYHGPNPWDTPDIYLCTLCSNCHKLEESIKQNDLINEYAKSLNRTCIHIWKGMVALTYIEKCHDSEHNKISDIIDSICWGSDVEAFMKFLNRPNG